jgi:phosphate transport system substrate-binding protein
MKRGTHVLALLLGFIAPAHGLAQDNTVVVMGSFSGTHNQGATAKAFMRHHPDVRVKVVGYHNAHAAKQFVGKKCDVMMFSGRLGETEKRLFTEAYGKDEAAWPRPYVYGRYCVYVIVNKASPLRRITYQQLSDIYEGRAVTWDQVGQPSKARITVVWERRGTKAREVFMNEIMKKWYFRDDFLIGRDCFEVAAKVARDRNAIGFCLYQHRKLDGVRALAIAKEAGGPFYKPTSDNVLEGTYPPIEDLTLYPRPGASSQARAYCEFACGPESAKMAKTYFLFPEYDRHAHFAEKRLKAVRAGKGTRLSVIGAGVGRTTMAGLAAEFVRAKAVVQLSYAPVASDLSAIGSFIAGRGGRQGLLILNGRPSGKAWEMYGEKWNELMPEKRVIAGRAVAIIVNRANKTKSLTLDQVRAIFDATTNNWATVGSTGLTTGGKGAAIRRFGLPSTDPATAIFHKNGLAAAKIQRVTRKKNTAAVVAAVSMDANAIGFVDLAAIPRTGQTVKVLPIQLGLGERARIIAPSAQNIRTAMYALSGRTYVYVHPKASKTAKDFAKFIATCGGSEATPYADTVKAMMGVYRKHGLIPLGEGAIDRIAKDAAAARAKAAAVKLKQKSRK